MMTRAQHRKQLQEGLNTVFGMEYKRYPNEWAYCYDVRSSRKAYEEDVLNVGLAEARVKAEGGEVPMDQGGESWTARYVHETIALGFSLTEEAEEDNLYGSLGARYSRGLARSMQHTKEVKGATPYNTGFSTFLSGDGVALLSESHPLFNGGVLSNTLATPADLSETALENMMIQISNWDDDRGIPTAHRAMRLLIAPANEFVAERITQSPGQSHTETNAINALRNMGRIPQGVAVNHRFTNPKAWFLKTDCPNGMCHFRRISLKRGVEGDFKTGNMRYKARERYRFGVTDPRGVAGSAGT